LVLYSPAPRPSHDNRAAGFDALLIKPINKAILLETLGAI
jgi:hypothetical protein